MTSESWSREWEAARAQSGAGRPFVTACFASSIDGCLTAERGRPTKISSHPTLVVAHQLRAAHDALLVGVGTILADDPQLTNRYAAGRSPLRVVLDTHLRTPPAARLFREPGAPPVLVTSAAAPPARARALIDAGARLLHVPRSAGGVSLPDALRALMGLGVRAVMVEGGAHVLDSFFSEGLVDYVLQTIAPVRLAGPRALRLGAETVRALGRWPHRTLAMGEDTLALGRWDR